MDEKALDRLKQNAKLATDFISRHGIRRPEDLYKNPEVVKEYLATRTDIPIQERTLDTLASSLQAAEQLDNISNLRQEEPEKPQKNPFAGATSLLGAPVAAFIETDDVKLAQVALTEPSPEVNLHQFIPTDIAADQEFQAELGKVKDPFVEGLKKQNPKISKKEIDEKLRDYEESLSEQAIKNYNSSAERSDKINKAREHDIYLKDAKGNIIGEKVFTDKKGKPNPYADPLYRSYQRQKHAVIDAAIKKNEQDRKNKIKPRFKDNELKRLIELQYDVHFAALFPQKAAAYAKVDERLKISLRTLKKGEKKLNKKEEKQARKEDKKTGQTPAPKAPRTQKSANAYQREFNNNALVKAAKRGYDRSALARKIREKLRIRKSSTTASSGEAQQPQQTQNQTGLSNLQQFSPRNLTSSYSKRYGNPISRLGRKINPLGQGTLKGAVQSGTKKVGSQLTKKAVSQAGKAAVKAVAANPVVLLIALAVVLILTGAVMLVILFNGGDGGGSEFTGGTPPGGGLPPPNSNPIPGFTLTKSVSATELLDSQQVTYTLSYTVNELSPTDSIVIYDTIPQNATLIQGSITGNYIVDSVQNTISWSLLEPENQNLSSFTFSVLPTSTDINISNSAWATAQSDSLLVSTNNCSGYYLIDNPKGNFGDPNCNFATNNAQAKSDLHALLKQLDPANADYWYTEVIPCESSYNPNAYNPNSWSGNGGYGFYQMNPKGKSTSGDYDIGDVVWTEQTSNAVNLLKEKGRRYWDCFL